MCSSDLKRVRNSAVGDQAAQIGQPARTNAVHLVAPPPQIRQLALRTSQSAEQCVTRPIEVTDSGSRKTSGVGLTLEMLKAAWVHNKPVFWRLAISLAVTLTALTAVSTMAFQSAVAALRALQ